MMCNERIEITKNSYLAKLKIWGEEWEKFRFLNDDEKLIRDYTEEEDLKLRESIDKLNIVHQPAIHKIKKGKDIIYKVLSGNNRIRILRERYEQGFEAYKKKTNGSEIDYSMDEQGSEYGTVAFKVYEHLSGDEERAIIEDTNALVRIKEKEDLINDLINEAESRALQIEGVIEEGFIEKKVEKCEKLAGKHGVSVSLIRKIWGLGILSKLNPGVLAWYANYKVSGFTLELIQVLSKLDTQIAEQVMLDMEHGNVKVSFRNKEFNCDPNKIKLCHALRRELKRISSIEEYNILVGYSNDRDIEKKDVAKFFGEKMVNGRMVRAASDDGRSFRINKDRIDGTKGEDRVTILSAIKDILGATKIYEIDSDGERTLYDNKFSLIYKIEEMICSGLVDKIETFIDFEKFRVYEKVGVKDSKERIKKRWGEEILDKDERKLRIMDYLIDIDSDEVSLNRMNKILLGIRISEFDVN